MVVAVVTDLLCIAVADRNRRRRTGRGRRNKDNYSVDLGGGGGFTGSLSYCSTNGFWSMNGILPLESRRGTLANDRALEEGRYVFTLQSPRHLRPR